MVSLWAWLVVESLHLAVAHVAVRDDVLENWIVSSIKSWEGLGCCHGSYIVATVGNS